MATEGDARAEAEGRFRAANEQIETKAVELGVEGPVPFLCECADVTCREILLLSIGDFRQIREHPLRFAVAPEHDTEPDEVVERRDGMAVVERRGREGQMREAEGDTQGDAV